MSVIDLEEQDWRVTKEVRSTEINPEDWDEYFRQQEKNPRESAVMRWAQYTMTGCAFTMPPLYLDGTMQRAWDSLFATEQFVLHLPL